MTVFALLWVAWVLFTINRTLQEGKDLIDKDNE